MTSGAGGPAGNTITDVWSLLPEIRHLNHGSFGAVPIPVQEEQRRWMERWEQATSRFISDEFQPAIDQARSEVAEFVGASADGFAFVRNATTAIAGVVRSLEPQLQPGDEILTTGQAYNAVRQTLEFTAARTGAKLVNVDVPLRLDTPSQVIDLVLDGVSGRTRLAVVDHISSPTGQVFPIADIVSALEPVVPVLVDGAHGPGQVPLDLDGLAASWYTGNLHKWVCAPKGSAFLATRQDRIEETFPVVISHAWNMAPGKERYRALFDWLGTDDPSPWLAAPEAIRVVAGLEAGGWPAVMESNHDLVVAGQELICRVLGTRPPYPESMIGSMAAIELPADSGQPSEAMLSPVLGQLMALGFETVVMHWPAWPDQLLRVSAHQYNRLEEYEALAGALSDLFATN